MSKFGKVVLGAGVFLVLSGGLLALAGRGMGAETRMYRDTPYGALEISPFNIRGIHTGSIDVGDIHVGEDGVRLGGYGGIEVRDDEVRLGGPGGITVTDRGVSVGGQEIGAYSNSLFDPEDRPTWSVPAAFKGKDQLTAATDLAAFSRLDVDVDIGSVILQYGESYGVELRWYGNNGYRLDYTNKDGTLKIWSTDSSQNKPNQKCSGYVVVTLPQAGRLDELDVEAELGGFYTEGVGARDMDLTCSMGSLTLLGVEAEDMNIAADLGSVEVLDSKVTRLLTVKASMGSVTLAGDFPCDVDIDADMGSVEFFTAQAREAYSYALDADMGSVAIDGETQKRGTANGSGGSHNLDITANMGGLEVWFSGMSPEGAQGVVRDNDLPDYLYSSYPEHEDKSVGFYAAPLSYDFTVRSDTNMCIYVENISGDLELGIRKKSGEWALEQRAFDTESEEVELERGSYTLVIQASAFQGSYELIGEAL